MKQKYCWTEEKVIELKEMWKNNSPSKLASYFHTTTNTILEKASELGLKYKSNRWTKEEVELLKEYASKYVTLEIAQKLGKSYLAVQKKANKLGIILHSEESFWEDWKIEYLKENINKLPIGQIGKKINMSYRRILTECSKLGITYIKEDWTDEEVAILRKYAKSCHYSELTKVLPRRTVGAICAKAYELGIETISEYTKLTDENINFIKDNWGKMTATNIARELKVSLGVIYRYKKILNLPNVGQKIKWTPERIKKLAKDAKTMSKSELAKKYKTSNTQIYRIAVKNGISLINSRTKWTKENEEELERLLAENLSIKEIQKKMNLKSSVIREKIQKLELNKIKKLKQTQRWTKEEVNILIELGKEKNISELEEILGKNRRQITSKARKLNVELISDKQKNWTLDDTNLLLSLYDKYEFHIIAQVMEKSESLIRSKARELNIKLKFKSRTLWTAEEESNLRNYAKEFTTNEIAHILNRTTASVNSKLQYMGISACKSPRYWSIEDINQLKELAKNNDISEIAQIMGKSYESINAALYRIGLKAKNKSNRPWTDEEKEKMLELLTTYSLAEVAIMLDRSEEAVMVNAIKMGYEIDYKNRKWTNEEEELLTNLWGNKSIEYISEKLNRTESAIINRVYVLGLGSQIANNYDGLTITDIANMFSINRMVILTSWVNLGLKINLRKRSNYSTYAFVTIDNLYEFLEKNQNIWDSRVLEKNILGKEPEWLLEKRKKDKEMPKDCFNIDSLTKQKLLQAKKYYLEIEQKNNELETQEIEKLDRRYKK